MAEYDFPTVRKGSYFLCLLASLIAVSSIVHGWTGESASALAATLTALTGTHATLVLGGSFNNSTLSRPRDNISQETTTTNTVKTVPIIPTEDSNA